MVVQVFHLAGFSGFSSLCPRFMDFVAIKNVAKQMRHFCAKPREALQWLLEKPSRENG
jgi:hypothetical protein